MPPSKKLIFRVFRFLSPKKSIFSSRWGGYRRIPGGICPPKKIDFWGKNLENHLCEKVDFQLPGGDIEKICRNWAGRYDFSKFEIFF